MEKHSNCGKSFILLTLLVILKSFNIIYEQSAVNYGLRREWLDK